MYVYAYVFKYVYIYLHVCIHIYIYIQVRRLAFKEGTPFCSRALIEKERWLQLKESLTTWKSHRVPKCATCKDFADMNFCVCDLEKVRWLDLTFFFTISTQSHEGGFGQIVVRVVLCALSSLDSSTHSALGSQLIMGVICTSNMCYTQNHPDTHTYNIQRKGHSVWDMHRQGNGVQKKSTYIALKIRQPQTSRRCVEYPLRCLRPRRHQLQIQEAAVHPARHWYSWIPWYLSLEVNTRGRCSKSWVARQRYCHQS